MANILLMQVITVGLMILLPDAAFTQEIHDTIEGDEFDEVVIKAPKIIRKADMDVLYPSRRALENSQNGMQLLNSLMIPSLNVNEILGSISKGGQPVQVRINGRVSTAEQVKNLLPETIRRVEWIDNPGLRYNGANYVLNIIVRNPEFGGAIMSEANPGLTTRFGKYNADVKFNLGKSQLSFGGYYKQTHRIRAHRDYSETFTYSDGESLTRIEKPKGGEVNDNRGEAWLTYSYIKPDTTVFYASMSGLRTISALEKYSGKLSLSNGSDNIHLIDANGSQGTTPSLSLYLEQHLSNNQTLVMDLGATLYSGHTFSDYKESLPDAIGYTTDINTYVMDINKAFAFEADYIKQWKTSRFSAGVSFAAQRNRSKYKNLNGSIYHQRQDKLYMFAEYYQRLNKFSLSAGIGAQYSDFKFRETNQGNQSWNLRPKVTLTYSPVSKHNLRLGFATWQTSPSLAETNIAPQQIDGFQWQIGNPGLKTSNYYALNFRYSFSLPRVDGVFGIRACTSPDAIAPYLYWEGDKLITTYENSDRYQSISFDFSPQIDIIPNWLMTNATISYMVERTRGTGYEHHNNNWSGNVGIMVTHWGFVLTGQYVKSERYLFGQRIKWNEDISIIDLSYKWNKWQFGAGILMPFGKYDQGSRLLSNYNYNEKHMRVGLRIPYLKMGYNIEWGRQKRGASKMINADASVETSSTGSR